VYVHIATGQQALSLDTNVGSQQHLHTSGLGKAILAHLPPERVDRIIDRHGLPQKTANTITDRGELLTELETIRERGLAYEREERVEGIQCVAAPVQDNDGQLLGAVSVSGPASRMTETRFEDEISEQVRKTATVIRINATYE
jgi:DNA-binding IclR family transcriptional regulator